MSSSLPPSQPQPGWQPPRQGQQPPQGQPPQGQSQQPPQGPPPSYPVQYPPQGPWPNRYSSAGYPTPPVPQPGQLPPQPPVQPPTQHSQQSQSSRSAQGPSPEERQVAPPAPVPPVRMPEPPAVTASFPRHDIPVLTLADFPGRRIAAVLGSVEGCVTRSRELEPRADLSEILMLTRQDAVDAMVTLALRAGADAVLGLRFDTSAISDGASEICAYGTAVKLAEED